MSCFKCSDQITPEKNNFLNFDLESTSEIERELVKLKAYKLKSRSTGHGQVVRVKVKDYGSRTSLQS